MIFVGPFPRDSLFVPSISFQWKLSSWDFSVRQLFGSRNSAQRGFCLSRLAHLFYCRSSSLVCRQEHRLSDAAFSTVIVMPKVGRWQLGCALILSKMSVPSRETESNRRPRDHSLSTYYSLPLYQLSYHGCREYMGRVPKAQAFIVRWFVHPPV